MLNEICSLKYITILDGLFLIVVMFLSLFLNVIILFLMYKKTAFHTPADVFLGCLSLANIFISIGPIPLCFAVYVYCGLPAIIWKVYKIVDIVANVTSITSLCIISCDRFYIIMFPFSYERNIKIKHAFFISAGVWVYGITISLMFLCMSQKFYLWFLLITSYFIQTLIMVLCYIFIAMVAKKHAKHIFSQQVHNKLSLEPRFVGEMEKKLVAEKTASACNLNKFHVQKIYNKNNDHIIKKSFVGLEHSAHLASRTFKVDASRSKSLSLPAKDSFLNNLKRKKSIWKNDIKRKVSVKNDRCILTDKNLLDFQSNTTNSKNPGKKKLSFGLEIPNSLETISIEKQNGYSTLSQFKIDNKINLVEVLPYHSNFPSSTSSVSNNTNCSLGSSGANPPDEIPNILHKTKKEKRTRRSFIKNINIHVTSENDCSKLNNSGLLVPDTNKTNLSLSLPELTSKNKCNSEKPNYSLITLPRNCEYYPRNYRTNSAPALIKEKRNSSFATTLKDRYMLLRSSIPWRKESIKIVMQIRKLRAELKASIILATLMAVFLCLWTPYIVVIIQQWKDGIFLNNNKVSIEKVKYYKFIYYCSATANPAFLVILYAKWRHAFIVTVKGLWRKLKACLQLYCCLK
ncbi:uncharacterized protein LOC136076159 isoform X1 [Hydra vulgaris]|uniref:uncharacterized protein LOC136076159 isoform X1 n=1 Tax=Hydra vulgaris TaxID=6087 RepID=UPI0032EA8BB4